MANVANCMRPRLRRSVGAVIIRMVSPRTFTFQKTLMTYHGVRSFCIVFALSLFAGSAILYTGCTNKAAQQGGFERPPAPVSVSAAVAQDVPTYLDAIGKTVAREVVTIQPQVSGRITKIHFTDGANVRKGDMLFTIDTRPFEANLAQAKWGLVQVNRYKVLAEQGVVSREQYEEFRANLDSLNANVGSARAAVNSAAETIKVDAAAVESAKVQLSYCFIRSPIDGRAGQRLADIGNVVNPGGSSGNNGSSSEVASNALLVIERLDPIYADFTISQNDLAQVQQQMQAGRLRTEVILPDSSDGPVIGQLTFLNN